jgi:hypothetical protein
LARTLRPWHSLPQLRLPPPSPFRPDATSTRPIIARKKSGNLCFKPFHNVVQRTLHVGNQKLVPHEKKSNNPRDRQTSSLTFASQLLKAAIVEESSLRGL